MENTVYRQHICHSYKVGAFCTGARSHRRLAEGLHLPPSQLFLFFWGMVFLPGDFLPSSLFKVQMPIMWEDHWSPCRAWKTLCFHPQLIHVYRFQKWGAGFCFRLLSLRDMQISFYLSEGDPCVAFFGIYPMELSCRAISCGGGRDRLSLKVVRSSGKYLANTQLRRSEESVITSLYGETSWEFPSTQRAIRFRTLLSLFLSSSPLAFVSLELVMTGLGPNLLKTQTLWLSQQLLFHCPIFMLMYPFDFHPNPHEVRIS